MPPRPDFDIYAALELTITATQDEISKAYRRLALLHHPDKNLGRPEATARFQQINTAYAILRNTGERQAYDGYQSSSAFPSADDSFGGTATRDYHGGYEYTDIDAFINMFHDAFNFSQNANPCGESDFNNPYGFSFSDGGPFGNVQPPDNSEQQNFENRRRRAVYRAEMKQQARDIEEIERLRKLVNMSTSDKMKTFEAAAKKVRYAEKLAQQENERLAKVAKKSAEDTKKSFEAEDKKIRGVLELVQQEVRWKEAKAVTNAQKQAICHHANFWPRELQKKKLKCGECGQKRGMTAFKCPFCCKLVCQMCIGRFVSG